MSVIKTIFTTLFLMIINVASEQGIPRFSDLPCNGTDDVMSYFERGLSDGYTIKINRTLNSGTPIQLKFDMDALITVDNSTARLVDLSNNVFKLVLLQDTDLFGFSIKGQFLLLPPYIISLKIKGVENCAKPNFGYFERHPVGAEKRPEVPNLFCGKRKVINELVNGEQKKLGAWPWYVTVYKLEGTALIIICGGTLISNLFILTAAYCVTKESGTILPPEIFVLRLGKTIRRGDLDSEEKQVQQVIVHEEFSYTKHDNDIALLKLKSPVKYNSFIQPVCLWFDKAQEKLPPGDVLGTVTGRGLEAVESIVPDLHEGTMLIVPDEDCLWAIEEWDYTSLNGKKFCAGYRNGSVLSQIYSGGGFYVYVPYEDSPFVQKYVKGAWYIRGIISFRAPEVHDLCCDPKEYVVFTDIATYTDWIYDHMD